MSMPVDVLIVGAGPAGSVAALVLARAGVRVRLIDRAAFPRDKLCGDTVNPGTMAALRRLGVASGIEQRGRPIRGMRVTGPTGVAIEGRYPESAAGRSILRRELDLILLEAAVDAGAMFEPDLRATKALLNGCAVAGAHVRGALGESDLTAPLTIAADGRHSTIAFGLGLSVHPAAPRRWAVGRYFGDVDGMNDIGEMHIRRGHYVGVAPLPDGTANVCVVTTPDAGRWRDPEQLVAGTLAGDPLLGPRFARARAVTPPVVLGPLAVDAASTGLPGLLLAGDAAGFIDPMTGDGLRFAVRGGELAAAAALDALARGWIGVHQRYRAARRREFAAKWRFNRLLRSLVATPAAIAPAAHAARIAPGILRAVIRKAGDCDRL